MISSDLQTLHVNIEVHMHTDIIQWETYTNYNISMAAFCLPVCTVQMIFKLEQLSLFSYKLSS